MRACRRAEGGAEPRTRGGARRWLWLAAVALTVTLTSPAQGEELRGVEAESAARAQPVPVLRQLENDAEMAAFRELERQHLPGDEALQRALAMGYGVAPLDRLALAGRPPLELLTREQTSAAREAGEGAGAALRVAALEGGLSEALEATRAEVAALREAQGEDGVARLPFGLDCLDQPSVQEYLALLTRPGSRTLKSWLQRAGRWREQVLPILDEEGVPRDLYYLAMIESGYQTQVRSPANAGGMWQFIPGTAADQGLEINAYVDERFDPIKATRAAARYLRKQHERFGSWPLAMAAYNGGAGTVTNAITAFNTNDYFTLTRHGAMYAETRRYVPKILAAAVVGENPEAFGFEGIEADAALRFDVVEVPGDVRLSLLADAADCELEALRELNPELIRDQTPPGVASYALRIPEGTHDAFVRSYDQVAERYGEAHIRYRLRFGETLEMAAEALGVKPRLLRLVNGIDRGDRVPYGAELLVPAEAVERVEAVERAEPEVVLVADARISLPERRRVFFDVHNDDTLEAVAGRFGVAPHEVVLWNNLDPQARLREPMTLQLFVDPGLDLSDVVYRDAEAVRAIVLGSEAHAQWRARNAPARARNIGYRVRAGDTVGRIARRYDVSVRDIVRWNNLDGQATIYPGMRLVIKK